MIIVYVTCKDMEEGGKIARHLLKKRMIACANIFPVSSLYWWNGKIVKDSEAVIIAKTTKANYNKVKEEVRKIHSYEVPCILALDAAANREFGAWVKKETSRQSHQ
jgi:periplasmic divalent cation tolerance protein